MKTVRKYGWDKDQPDHRDFKRAAPPITATLPPICTGMLQMCLPVYNQATLGSCTWNGTTFEMQFARQFARLKDGEKNLSRLFGYYLTRLQEGTVKQDSGAQIRDCMKVAANSGCCFEMTWPYDVAKFARKPSAAAYAEAKTMESLVYESVRQDINHIKYEITQNLPVIFGFTVYASFESDEVAKTGMMPMPGKKEQNLGGHCVVAIGYDDSKQAVLCRNSWGSEWGVNGYFWMPYAYITNPDLASDFWVISKVS